MPRTRAAKGTIFNYFYNVIPIYIEDAVKTPSDLTTNLEIKKLLDDYIKKKENNLNNKTISKVTKETKRTTNKEIRKHLLKMRQKIIL